MSTHAAIIPSYRRPQLLRQAIDCVLRQSVPFDEVIIVIDEMDEMERSRLLEEFPTIFVVIQRNLGLSAARNAGVAHASTEWVSFLDDDDMWHPERMAIVCNYLAKHPGCEALNHPMWWFSDREDGPTNMYGFAREFVASNLDECLAATTPPCEMRNRHEHLFIHGNSLDHLLRHNAGAASATTMTRRLFIASGGCPVSQGQAQDQLLFLNAARRTEWHTLTQPLGFYRMTRSQMTNRKANVIDELAALVHVWWGGRPPVGGNAPDQINRSLIAYHRTYRSMVQRYSWDAILTRDWTVLARVRELGRLLLPRWRDRLYTMFPPQLTWRIERYIFGMHK